MNNEIKTQVAVIGSGPGGYSAAFRCADLGLNTILIERYSSLGGVCLNVGCIPSKSLLHIVRIIKESKRLDKCGIIFGTPKIDINKIRIWKEKIVKKISNNLENLAKIRKIKIINGYGVFTDINTLKVKNKKEVVTVNFDNAIIAVGSRPAQSFLSSYEDKRIWDSTNALELTSLPKHLLIIGGGVIGMEMATIYHALGSKIDIVEILDQLIPAADKDIMDIFARLVSDQFNLMLETSIIKIEPKQDGIHVIMKEKKKSTSNVCRNYDAVLIATGRIPNSTFTDADKIGIKINKHGFIDIDKQMRTNIPHIFAIGDVTGYPMLAHKGIHEGRIAAEIIAGKKHYFDPKVIPSIAYTEPEIAWVGMTEKIAQEKGINYEVSIFPWSALGRAIISDYQDGITKLLFDKKTNRLIGGSIIGVNSGELLGEIGIAIEMGCESEDIALTVHAHPTLYESIGLSAEIYDGTITDLLNIKNRKKNN